MPLTANQQKLLDFAKSAVPRFLFEGDGAAELTETAAVTLDFVYQWLGDTFAQTYLAESTNGPPDFLNQHAKDRGTFRRDGETDAALRKRLRFIPDSLTLAALEDAINDVLVDAAIVGTVGLVELRFDRAFFVGNLPMTGTGGSIVADGADWVFVPDDKFAIPPRGLLTLSGCTDAGNDITQVEIDDVVGDGAKYVNATGVAESGNSATWTVERVDVDGNVTDGRFDAYFDRGFRMGNDVNAIVVILPYGTTATVTAAVVELLRQRAAAGILTITETRQNP